MKKIELNSETKILCLPRVTCFRSICPTIYGHEVSKTNDQFYWHFLSIFNDHYNPRFNEVEREVYWFHLVRPSVRMSVYPSVDKIVSTLYLQQYSSDLFHICTSYQATSEGVSCVMFVSKLKFFKFWRILLTWDPIWLNSMGHHEAAGVSSERRHSSCSSIDGCFRSLRIRLHCCRDCNLRDSPTVWPPCAFLSKCPKFMCPSMWKRKNMINFVPFGIWMCLKDKRHIVRLSL